MSRPDWGALQQEYIAEYTRSGISPVAWCEARGLNYATARRYIKKTPKNAQTEMCKTAQKSAQKKSAQTAQKRNEKSQEKKPVFDAGLNEGDAEEFSFCPDEFGISDQQAKFAMLVAQGKKPTEAYRLAGYEGQGATANSNASRMLRNARVFRAISYFRNQYQKRYTADLESRLSSKLTQDQKSLLLHREEITALMEKNVAIEKNNRLIKESAEIAAWRDSLQASIDNRQQGYDIQIAGYGVGDKNQQRQQELLRIEREYNNQRLQLERDYADKSRGMSNHVFQEKMQALNDALEREKEIVRQKNEQLDIQAGDWVSGASQGFNNWLDDTKDISEQIKSTTTQIFDGMTDALGDFVTTGKANFRSFATSVISDLSRIALKASITGIFDSISNSSSGGILGTIGSAISKFIPNAKGGVYESPSLNTYSNGIYDSPQFFAFARGAGVFGEAGPEAIMPLTRTSDGSLGVRAINSKSGNGGGDITYAPVYQITIQNDGQNGEIGPQAIKALMGMVDLRVQGNLLNMRRDGGMLSG
ncbi:phage tail tape measure protein [Escherichia coli]|uniref:phage tail tape measure protein n=1 Tax=Escherichia coli TaxID=562 RepID=UPI003FD25F2D